LETSPSAVDPGVDEKRIKQRRFRLKTFSAESLAMKTHGALSVGEGRFAGLALADDNVSHPERVRNETIGMLFDDVF
jgi:hypothetical protein